MSQPDESPPHARSADYLGLDPVIAMRAHIGHLESELAATAAQLHRLESRANDVCRRVAKAIETGDHQRARDAVLEHDVNWEALDEEVGLLKADMRVLRVLLAECHDWLKASDKESPQESPPPLGTS